MLCGSEARGEDHPVPGEASRLRFYAELYGLTDGTDLLLGRHSL